MHWASFLSTKERFVAHGKHWKTIKNVHFRFNSCLFLGSCQEDSGFPVHCSSSVLFHFSRVRHWKSWKQALPAHLSGKVRATVWIHFCQQLLRGRTKSLGFYWIAMPSFLWIRRHHLVQCHWNLFSLEIDADHIQAKQEHQGLTIANSF